MSDAPSAGEIRSSSLGDALSIFRYHIVLIAMAAALVFGWLMTGRYPYWLTLVVGLDWFLINLMNRVTDLAEDLENNIQGTDLVARHGTLFSWGSAVLMIGSFIAVHLIWPELTPWRIAVQLIGLGYNYDIVPSHRGMTRFKELYFFKNFMSSVLFVLTCFVYPIAIDPAAVIMEPRTIAVLALFFVPFELTYEILYDLRDLDGDRAEGVPTYPVVHGPEQARRIIDGLLVGSSLVLIVGLLWGAIGVLEGLMLAAPAIQFAVYRPRYRRGVTARDCILLTHLGSALLLFYAAGTAIWLEAGLPPNVHLF